MGSGVPAADRGAPDSITMDDLSDWSQSADPGVKYFSGIGTYAKTLQVSPDGSRRERNSGSTWVT